MKAHAAKEAGAKTLEIWGSGTPLREFLHVDDLADALLFMLRHYDGAAPLNIGSGQEISIAALAQMIAETVGFEGSLVYNKDYPDGVERKIMDSSRIKQAGWRPSIDLASGLQAAYAWYREQAGLRDAA
jgi:GDP-L-fucose synthase